MFNLIKAERIFTKVFATEGICNGTERNSSYYQRNSSYYQRNSIQNNLTQLYRDAHIR